MNQEELIAHTEHMMQRVSGSNHAAGRFAEVREFFRVYAGPKSSFFKTVEQYDPYKLYDPRLTLLSILEGFRDYVKVGLQGEISPERRAQLDVVSDFLEMANRLLENKQVHPAAPAMLIGATLEEFLRTWIEAEGLALGNRKPGIETYSQVLREADLITKQDGKDITAWSGTRNHAAHGEWEEVGDRSKISWMLEGVNLFMRKYS